MPQYNDESNTEEQSFKLPCYENITQQRMLHFYLCEPVEEPAKYIDMIHKIKTAGPNDVVYIYLNTPGGQLDTGLQIISAMKTSPAHIVTVLEGEICSLGTMIFLSGDEFVVHDHCLFMIHNYSGGTYGKGHEQVAQIEAQTREFGKLMRSIYYPFLDEDEVERVVRGEDFWMGSDEVRTRLQKMIKILEKEAKAKEREEKAAQSKKTGGRKSK